MRTANYNTFLARVAGLIGVAGSELQDAEKTIINGFFNNAIESAWESNYWLDLVSKGEARFIGNILPYPNNYAYPVPGYWLPSSATVTNNQISNPLDGRVTAAKLVENTIGPTDHYLVSQTFNVLPSTEYKVSVYVRANARSFVVLSLPLTVNVSASFNLTTGAVVSQSGCTASCGVIANGFCLCSVTFTTGALDKTTNTQLTLSTNGTTTVYAGTVNYGVYVWGYTCIPTSSGSPVSQLLPFVQLGEEDLEAVFQVYKNTPSAVTPASTLPYYLVPTGVQLIGSGSGGNPVYVDYRKPVPLYEGAAYSASATYAIGDQILFTTSAGIQNFYKCIVTTSAGQSPATTATSWEVLAIPQFLLDHCVYNVYSQWLRVEGRNGAAEIMEGRAQAELDQESDRQERQMGDVMPTKFQTHVSVQPR